MLGLLPAGQHPQACSTRRRAPALVVDPEAEAEGVLAPLGVCEVQQDALLLLQERKVRLCLALRGGTARVGRRGEGKGQHPPGARNPAPRLRPACRSAPWE